MHCFTLNSLASCFCNIIMCLLIKFVFVVAVVVVNVPWFCVFLRYRNENAPRHWNGMPLIWLFYICHYQFSKLMATFNVCRYVHFPLFLPQAKTHHVLFLALQLITCKLSLKLNRFQVLRDQVPEQEKWEEVMWKKYLFHFF